MVIREVKENDLLRCADIEKVSYTGDEAADKAKILKRIQQYPEGFIVLEVESEVVGFINSGATNLVDLSDEEFKDLEGHDSDGFHIVIMSVVVHPDHQGKGYAGQLLANFIGRMREMAKKSIYLLCQKRLIPFYENHGFHVLGKSKSDHGGLQWYEMSLVL